MLAVKIILALAAAVNVVAAVLNGRTRMALSKWERNLREQEEEPKRAFNEWKVRQEWIMRREREKEDKRTEDIITGLNAKIVALHTLLQEQGNNGGDGSEDGDPAVDDSESVNI